MSCNQQALVVLAVALYAAIASKDEVAVAAPGAVLAQGSVKFAESALISEVMSDPMEQFATLDDVFDDKALGATDSSENLPSRNGDFDASANDLQVEEIQADFTKWLSSPTLWFTASLILGAIFFMTSPGAPGAENKQSSAETETETETQIEIPLAGAISLVSAEPETEKDAVLEQQDDTKDESKVNEATETMLIQKTMPLEGDVAETAEEDEEKEEAARVACGRSLKLQLNRAAKSCRSSEEGAYANFCRLLAQQQEAEQQQQTWQQQADSSSEF